MDVPRGDGLGQIWPEDIQRQCMGGAGGTQWGGHSRSSASGELDEEFARKSKGQCIGGAGRTDRPAHSRGSASEELEGQIARRIQGAVHQGNEEFAREI